MAGDSSSTLDPTALDAPALDLGALDFGIGAFDGLDTAFTSIDLGVGDASGFSGGGG